MPRAGWAVRCAPAVDAAADLELGPRVDVGDDVEAVADADVAVVFSTPDVAVDHVLACVRLGVHAVVGTTGWTPERLDRVRADWPGPALSASSWHRTSRSARSC